MSEQEMREMDAFCAEKVMGWVVGTGMVGQQVCRDKEGKLTYVNFMPSEDRSTAMEVLEKCAKCRTVAVNLGEDGKFAIGFVQRDSFGLGFCITDVLESDTLPLAICLFAKKLFETK